MNKKVLAILALLIVATSIGAVSAFDLGDLFGAQNETVTLDGVDFNIPSGFKEDTSGAADKMLGPLKEQGAEFTSKVYVKDNTVVALFVMNVTAGLTNEQALEIIGGNETTINNVTGYISYVDDEYLFNFEKNDRVVMMSTDDEKLIGDFLIA